LIPAKKKKAYLKRRASKSSTATFLLLSLAVSKETDGFEMRANHGKHSKNKGSAFEREAGKQLSLWLTAGERPDTFSRNVLSGGSFTNAELRGEKSSRMPGDLMAAHPLAFAFLSQFSVECKHYEDIGLDAYLWDTRARTMLGEFIYHTKRQAVPVDLEYMLIAKQDYRDGKASVPV
jgi:hypothetical protein